MSRSAKARKAFDVRLLLTGATGNIGRELTRILDADGIQFRALVRTPERADTLPAHADPITGDLDDPGALERAMDGVAALFLLVPGIGSEHTRSALKAAENAGVGRIVLISSAHVLVDPLPAMGSWHHERETMVRAGGIPFTILRPGGYMSNALEWIPNLRAGEPILDPSGPGRYAPIDPADIAAVAAHCLTEPGHESRHHHLTGPDLLTLGEQVAIFARILHRDIRIRETVTPGEAVAARFPNGAPPRLAAAIQEGFALMRADTVGVRTDTVAELLGRPARTFTEWCEAHRAAFPD
ncbi:NAD-dependent epimerase/dehydratase family protein [Nocardia yunnanensis]|uniref:NAD-dependent epimerase/dehydratase family protein n=1 Tax=Nocardia yunnanensis TaxID=2382165 RepID=A0A386ZED7_9NOCA|nr:NAD(P)H-binding protein [Nocardia yunnanensis]AYF75553.1 NAD-dependent epimerase/dehydratase family protein [Nocardia yunnanensis]